MCLIKRRKWYFCQPLTYWLWKTKWRKRVKNSREAALNGLNHGLYRDRHQEMYLLCHFQQPLSLGSWPCSSLSTKRTRVKDAHRHSWSPIVHWMCSSLRTFQSDAIPSLWLNVNQFVDKSLALSSNLCVVLPPISHSHADNIPANNVVEI